MNYKKIYEELIKSAKINPKDDEYKEIHHIIPVCIGGTDDIDNLVNLTARQHFLAHWLLYKIHRTSKLMYAWNCMRIIGKGQDTRIVNSHLFEYVKKEKSRFLSEYFSGENNNFYGKHHTDYSKKLMSDKLKGRKHTKETKDMMSLKRKGVKKTEDHKSKIGRKDLISLKNVKSGESIRIHKDQISGYDQNMWVNPYTYKMMFDKKKEVECDVCGKIGCDNSSFRRWHFDNCRGKK